MRGRAVVMVIVPPPHAAEAEGGDLGDEEEHVRSVRGPIRWVMAVEGVQRCAHAWLTRGEWGRASTGVARPSLVRAVAAVRVGSTWCELGAFLSNYRFRQEIQTDTQAVWRAPGSQYASYRSVDQNGIEVCSLLSKTLYNFVSFC